MLRCATTRTTRSERSGAAAAWPAGVPARAEPGVRRHANSQQQQRRRRRRGRQQRPRRPGRRHWGGTPPVGARRGRRGCMYVDVCGASAAPWRAHAMRSYVTRRNMNVCESKDRACGPHSGGALDSSVLSHVERRRMHERVLTRDRRRSAGACTCAHVMMCFRSDGGLLIFESHSPLPAPKESIAR